MGALERNPDCGLAVFCEVVGRDPFFILGRWPNDRFVFRDLKDVLFAPVSEVPTPWMCLQQDLRLAGIDTRSLRLHEGRSMAENAEAFNREVLMPWLMQYTMQEAWTLAQQARVLSGPFYTPAALLADGHFKDRGMWVEIDHPVAGRYTYPGRPIIMGETPWELRRPAPQLGEHNHEVYAEALGYRQEELARLRGMGVI